MKRWTFRRPFDYRVPRDHIAALLAPLILRGSITPSGSLIKKIAKAFSGSITPTGALVKEIKKPFSGSIAPTGALTIKVSKAFSGSITPSGSLSTITFTVIAEPVKTENLMFIEQVKFSEPYGLQLVGGDDQRLGVFLAQRGLDKELDQDYHSKDRDIHLGPGQTIRDGAGNDLGGAINSVYPPRGEVPVGGVIFWPSTSGDIPEFWGVFSAGQGRFLAGADGDNLINGTTGGAFTVALNHTHGSGTLETDSDAHTHGPGTLDTDDDAHTHGPGTLSTGPPDSVDAVTAGAVDVAADKHFHSITAGVTAIDTHDHAVDAGLTASDAHTHSVDTGSTATALSSSQSILPPYLVGTWIVRTS